MIYLSNFFARHIEAVSKQVEDARGSKTHPIVTCCYFLGQKPLQIKDIKDNIWIFPQKIYPLIASLVLLFTKSDIHYFEDEPSAWRLFFLNLRERNIYVSLFKDIDQKLVQYLNKIKNLKSISVEDEKSEKIVRKYLENKKVGIHLQYPSPLWKPKIQKSPENIHLIFASWNGGDKATLDQRGITDLLTLVKSKKVTCTIILRDDDIDFVKSQIKINNIGNLVNLVKPKNFEELREEFKKAAYVVLIPREAVMKYVPNSIIDGLSMGKPCLISKSLRFHKLVEQENLGLVFEPAKISSFSFPPKDKYHSLSKKCYAWSLKNLDFPYSKSIAKIYN